LFPSYTPEAVDERVCFPSPSLEDPFAEGRLPSSARRLRPMRFLVDCDDAAMAGSRAPDPSICMESTNGGGDRRGRRPDVEEVG
jgi:hypothetical protein